MCIDCLKMTKAIQKSAEALQGVADLYDDHVNFYSCSQLLLLIVSGGCVRHDGPS